MTQAIYVQWSDDGQHIRKWSREPFEGAETFAIHQSGRTGAGEALREALLAIRQSIEDAAYACKPCRADCGPVQACNVSMEIIDAALSQSTAGEDVT